MIPGGNRLFLIGALAALLVIFFSFSGYGAGDDSPGIASETPHIVVILVDDMGYGDIGAYNARSKIQTPNMDRLAEEGMRFTDAHAPGAVCHPSRYGLMTGRYPFRTDVSVWPNEPLIARGQMTIASLLRSKGYRTAMIGKWHLGFDESEAIRTGEDDRATTGYATMAHRNYRPNQSLPGGPVDCGFDSFFGIRASTDIPPYFYIRDDQVVAPPTDSVEDNHSEGWSDIQGAFWRAGGIAPDLDLAEVLPRFTNEAVQLIERHHAQHTEQPLFLYVALPAPHTPWLPSEAFRGTSGAGEYGDFVSMVDSEVGTILSALERAGMAENTMVVLTSDNGPVWYPQDAERYHHHSNAGIRSSGGSTTSEMAYFRGMKGDAHEGGHHMPFIVRWPNVVEAGSITGQTISFVDVLATIADIVDVELPRNAGEDSFSILPVLTGKQPEERAIRPPVVTLSSRGVKSIQDSHWKLIESLGSGGFTSPVHIEPSPQGPQGQLYHIGNDPSESTNLWNDQPQRVEQLRALLREWERDGTSRP